MTESNYDYRGLLASTWDLWRDDTSNWSDRSFFLDVIKRYGQPVLDLGCGTGRLMLDYLADGVEVHGVDNSPEMLAICGEKAVAMSIRPQLFQQPLQELNLPHRYRTILGPSSVLQLVTDVGQASQSLRRIFEHLHPGGAFVTSFSFQWRDGDPLDSGWQLLFEKSRPSDGAIVRSWTREWHQPDHQLWHSEQKWEIELNGEVIEREHQNRSPEGRWYTQAQAVGLFRGVGFQRVRALHEFTFEDAGPDDRLFCVLGER